MTDPLFVLRAILAAAALALAIWHLRKANIFYQHDDTGDAIYYAVIAVFFVVVAFGSF